MAYCSSMGTMGRNASGAGVAAILMLAACSPGPSGRAVASGSPVTAGSEISVSTQMEVVTDTATSVLPSPTMETNLPDPVASDLARRMAGGFVEITSVRATQSSDANGEVTLLATTDSLFESGELVAHRRDYAFVGKYGSLETLFVDDRAFSRTQGGISDEWQELPLEGPDMVVELRDNIIHPGDTFEEFGRLLTIAHDGQALGSEVISNEQVSRYEFVLDLERLGSVDLNGTTSEILGIYRDTIAKELPLRIWLNQQNRIVRVEEEFLNSKIIRWEFSDYNLPLELTVPDDIAPTS